MKQEVMLIADLRAELSLSLEAFGALIGINSRGRMSVIERENRCSLRVALELEKLSGGRIDAAGLCDDVKMARHIGINTADADATSPGKTLAFSREVRS